MARYRNNNLSKTLKDYAVPIVGLVLILILLFSVFSWDNKQENKETKQNIESQNSIQAPTISLANWDTKAYIIYENGRKEEIKWNSILQKSEKIEVESWKVLVDFPMFAKMNLDEKAELLYKDDWTVVLNSWQIWLEALDNIDLFMKYANVSIPSWAIVNLKQNDLESNIYSISGDILVSNLAWKSAQLHSKEKLTIKSKDATSWDINLDSLKKQLDDYFKLSSWFKENNWDKIIENKEVVDNFNSGSLSTWSLLEDNGLEKNTDLISFDNLKDESYVKTDNLNIVGRYDPLKVSKITINNLEAKLNSELGTFSIKWFKLNSKINDLVIKIFDKNWNIISKKILTIYTNKISNSSNNIISNKVENFPVRATDFIIYEPTTTGKLVTKSSQITIRWKVKNKNVAKVLVNDYRLKSFNWSTWRYHAFVEQGTLKPWANNYEIKYLDKDWNLIYKEYYSIYKEIPKTKQTKKFSWEAKIN